MTIHHITQTQLQKNRYLREYLELEGHLWTVLELESRRIHSATRLVQQESLGCVVTNGSGGVYFSQQKEVELYCCTQELIYSLKEVDTLNQFFLGDAGGSCKILDLTFGLVIG